MDGRSSLEGVQKDSFSFGMVFFADPEDNWKKGLNILALHDIYYPREAHLMRRHRAEYSWRGLKPLF